MSEKPVPDTGPDHPIRVANPNRVVVSGATCSRHKGEANCYRITGGGDRSVIAVRVHKSPYAAVAEITDHVALHPDRIHTVAEQLSA